MYKNLIYVLFCPLSTQKAIAKVVRSCFDSIFDTYINDLLHIRDFRNDIAYAYASYQVFR